jgi:hypothetical protein
VGSYQSAERSNLARDKINGELYVPLSVSVVQVAGKTWHRLMLPEWRFSEDVAQVFEELKIEPWRITIKEPLQPNLLSEAPRTPVLMSEKTKAHKQTNKKTNKKTNTNVPTGNQSQPTSLLVAEFTDISAALELERTLTAKALPVFGKAVVKQGSIVHQVWVGPVSNIAAAEADVKAAGYQLDPSGEKVVLGFERPMTKPMSPPQPAKAKPAKVKTPNKKYPKDFNLARLPPKKPKKP